MSATTKSLVRRAASTSLWRRPSCRPTRPCDFSLTLGFLFAESLNDLVAFHRTHKIVVQDNCCLVHSCKQAEGENDLEEFVDKKTAKLLKK